MATLFRIYQGGNGGHAVLDNRVLVLQKKDGRLRLLDAESRCVLTRITGVAKVERLDDTVIRVTTASGSQYMFQNCDGSVDTADRMMDILADCIREYRPSSIMDAIHHTIQAGTPQ